MNGTRNAYGLGSGTVAIVLLIAGFLAVDDGGATPASGPTSALVNEILTSTTRIQAGAAIGLLGAGLLVWFGAALRRQLSTNPTSSGDIVGSVAHGFSLIAAIAGLTHGAQRLAVSSIDDGRALGEAVRAVTVLAPVPMTVLELATIGLTVTLSIAGWRAHLLHRGTAVLGFLLGGVAALFLITDRGGPGLLVLAWIAVVAAKLAVDASRNASAPDTLAS